MNNTIKNFQEKEIWKEIQGYEGEYEISTKGRVRNIMTGRILGGTYDCYGYRFVKLKGKNYKIHRLVALAFLPNPSKLPQVNHKNERKDDNNVGNLEWCSASYNTNYSSHNQSCKIKQLNKDGELIRTWESSHQIERETGYSQGYILKCCKGKYKQAYGFQWEYLDSSSQRIVNRPVAALTKDGEFVAKYKSAAEAARFLKIKKEYVSRCLKGTYKSIHGLKFVYLD